MSRFLIFIFANMVPGLYLIAQQPAATDLLRQWHDLDSTYDQLRNNDFAQSLQISRRQIELANTIHADSLLFKSLLNKGHTLADLGFFDAALTDFYSCLKIAERLKDEGLQSDATLAIGRIFQSMEDYGKSLEFMKKSRQLAINAGQLADTIRINSEIGFDLAGLEKWDEGLALLERSYNLACKYRMTSELMACIDNLSNAWAAMDNNIKALQYELELLKYPEAWATNLEKTGVYEHLSEIYIRLKDWDNAQKYQQLCLQYAKIINSRDWLFECYKLQSIIDEARGNFQSALKNHKMYLALKDSVYLKQYDVKMSAMSTQYELDSKEKTISLLERDKQIQESHLRQQRTERNAIGLIAVLLVAIIWLVIRFRHQRKAEALQEAFSQELIMNQENERRRISRELHDSVGQNILFIKNQLQRQPQDRPEQLMDSIDAALEEVRNISKALYPNQLEKYGLESAVDALCELTRESSGIFVSHDLSGIDEKLSRDARINFYRIIQECLSNTLKHAEATAVRISTTILPNKVELVVQDNGKGFDKSILERKSQRSFGMINLEERVKMLKGKFDLETAANKGTKMTFLFPV